MKRLSCAVGVLALALTACGSEGGSGASTAETTAATSEASSQLSGTVTVLAAASLTETFDQLKQQFTEEHPGVTVQRASAPPRRWRGRSSRVHRPTSSRPRARPR